MTRFGRNVFTLTAAMAAAVSLMLAQGPAGGGGGKGGGKGPAGPPPTAKTQAPIDLTGTWVSLVTEDWLYRMVTPKAGDFASITLTPAGRTAAMAWDPAKDEAAGQQCKSYGAAGLMRVPGRLNVDWSDDNTLRIQTDAGTQTRLMHFTGDVTGPASLQGFSKATWDGVGRGGGRGTPPAATNVAPGGAAPVRAGALKVVTTNMTGGYLRKNGVPYGPNTVLTEYYDVLHEPNGDLYLIISTIVDDAANIQGLFRTSTHFKKEANASKFKPSACSAR